MIYQYHLVICRNGTTTRHQESFEWTGRAVPPFSTASCTSCVTIASDKFTRKEVCNTHVLLIIILNLLICSTEKPAGYDRVRSAEIGNKDFELEVLDEAYTTEHWIVRIYKVKDMPNRGVV